LPGCGTEEIGIGASACRRQAALQEALCFQPLQEGRRTGLSARLVSALQTPLRCHELRINDKDKTWRIIYRLDDDAVVILEVFEKKSRKTPKHVIDVCKKRLLHYES
jgi:phage-related protein